MNNIILTVFTPAYNRAHTLPRTYESLCNQTNKNFIWMIVDDGSIDNTKELVNEWQSVNNGFEIQYFYKTNGGMHTAHNLAYQKIQTELNVCIDSDDMMPVDAIEKIIEFWDKKGSKDVAGIVALDADMNGKILGTELPKEITQTTTTKLYGKLGVTGDKKFIYRTDVINSVPAYPEFDGEKLVPLGYKYNLVAHKYEMLLLSEIVCLVDYQTDGSTNTIFRQYLQSPRGFMASNAVSMQCSENFVDRMKSVVHYIAECRIAKDKKWFKNSPRKFITILLYPLGFVAEKYIRHVNRRSN